MSHNQFHKIRDRGNKYIPAGTCSFSFCISVHQLALKSIKITDTDHLRVLRIGKY